MARKMLIDATHAEETRVVVVDGTKVEEFDFETVNKRQLAGNIYLAKVTRVEPSLQAAFVEYGGNRHGFLAFAEIHPDYYQIPVADRKALLEEERALARAEDDEDNRAARRRSPRPKAESAATDAVRADVAGMDVVDLSEEGAGTEEAGSDDAGAGGAGADDAPAGRGDHDDHDHAEPYRAMDTASEQDADIESVADEDVSEEISAPRRPRARRYKIQEVVKVRQIMLVQVVKEERGNKGAALTTYLSLAGRYCVLMPNTARGGGISRKITQVGDRKKLKEIAQEIEVPEGAGLIIRTAGAKRTKPEIRRDYEYLMRLWEQVRELTLKSMAPAAIYEEGNLIKRSIRDLYSREIDEVLVEGAEGFRTAKDFMRMIMPTHAKAVQPYNDTVPLFARHQVESYLAGMFNPTVQLKSGGYIVIGITEALVAIDVNSGRATKEGSIEDTATKTNLEAAEEVARQLRLRDLAGLIVIDFIDMEDRRNNAAVEKRLKDKLKTDRARIQVGRISAFGLMEMSRQRLRPGMLESTTQPCAHCHGTGLIRSDDSMALTILRALEEEGTRKRSPEVLLRAPVAVVNFLMNQKREHIAMIEARYGMSVRIEADPSLISPDYAIEKFKTATRVVPESRAISGSAAFMGAEADDIEDPDIPDEDDADEAGVVEEPVSDVSSPATSHADGDTNGDGRKKRRRRRRRRGGSRDGDQTGSEDDADGETSDASAEPVASDEDEPATARRSSRSRGTADAVAAGADEVEAPKKRTRTRSRTPKAEEARLPADGVPAEAVPEAAPKPKPTRSRSPRKPKAEVAVSPEVAIADAPRDGDTAAAMPDGTPMAASDERYGAADTETTADTGAVATAEVERPLAETSVTPTGSSPAPDVAAEEPPVEKPRRKGWWNLGR